MATHSESARQPGRQRRRRVAIQRRDVRVIELLVERRAETLDVLHGELFAGRARKRALNRLGELCSAGYLIRTVVDIPTEPLPQNVYTLAAKGRIALELRSRQRSRCCRPAFQRDAEGRVAAASDRHQSRADRLGVRLTPEHLLTRPAGPDKVRPHGVYLAGDEFEARREVWLEVDLGHYSRRRLLEKVRAAEQSHETRGVCSYARPPPAPTASSRGSTMRAHHVVASRSPS